MPSILIVEDELVKPLEENFFVELLQEKGYKLDFAETGNEAYTKLAENTYNMILMDIMIKPAAGGEQVNEELTGILRANMGVELIKWIREGEFAKQGGVSKTTPMIVVSATTGHERWEKIKKYIVDRDDILYKPCSPEEIVERIEEKFNSI